MLFSVNTLGCPDWDLSKIITFSKEIGISCLEIRGIQGKMTVTDIPEFSDEGYVDLKEKLKKNGIKIIGFGCSSSFHDPKRCGDAFYEAVNAINFCDKAGIGFVRIFGNNVPEAEKEAEIIERVAYYSDKLCKYAKEIARNCKAPVNVLLEAHGDFNTAERLCAVCKKVKNDNFGIIWDVAHVDRAYRDQYMSFYNALKPYIKHVHFKDHRKYGDEFKLCSVGEGDISLIEILELLKKDNFSGCISIEHEKKWHPELSEPEVEFKRFAELVRPYMST